jgi:hypothetical protein
VKDCPDHFLVEVFRGHFMIHHVNIQVTQILLSEDFVPPRRYYFRATDGAKLGPFNLNLVAEMIRVGKVKANTPISIDGEQFRPMKSLPEMATLLSVDVAPQRTGESADFSQVDTEPLFSGMLTEVSIPKLFYHCFASRATGCLMLINQSVKKELFLMNGKPVAANSNLERDRLGQHLIRT